jgi:hypothetical protein
MEVNKENMIKTLGVWIDRENANMNNTPLDDAKEIEIYKMGYIGALKNLLFAISVNGE